jgi:glutamate-1-semialdehyde 2,1-aminomutase
MEANGPGARVGIAAVGDLRSRAEAVLAGGVSAGWNAHGIGGPTHFASAAGARLTDIDGNEHIDFIVGWGSLMLGHDPPAIRVALEESLATGFGFQYESEDHVELAERLCAAIPCAEKVRLANSGLEATLYALRLARARTGRDKVIKFEGHFHGLHDGLLWSMDTSPRLGAVLPNGEIEPVPGSPGMPAALAEQVITLPFNEPELLADAVRRHRDSLAAVILEPIALNIGCIAPDPGFLDVARAVCSENDVVLIFDEVLTGFRVAWGGAQQRYDVVPDLACYSKAMSCGLPVAAVAGRDEIMSLLAPLGSVQMSGTNTARRLGVLGTLAGLREMGQEGFYDHVDRLNDVLVGGLRRVLAGRGVPAYVEGYGGRVGVFAGIEERPRDLRAICAEWNQDYHLAVYEALADQRLYGFMMPLSICPEAITICAAHTEADIDEALDRFDTVLASLPYATQRR